MGDTYYGISIKDLRLINLSGSKWYRIDCLLNTSPDVNCIVYDASSSSSGQIWVSMNDYLLLYALKTPPIDWSAYNIAPDYKGPQSDLIPGRVSNMITSLGIKEWAFFDPVGVAPLYSPFFVSGLIFKNLTDKMSFSAFVRSGGTVETIEEGALDD